MSKPKHTPGPWTVGSYDDDGDLAILVDTKTIALLDPRNFKYSGAPDGLENEANARLIAAAPDLLVALLRARHRLEKIGQDFPELASSTTLQIVEGAIEKATGGGAE